MNPRLRQVPLLAFGPRVTAAALGVVAVTSLVLSASSLPAPAAGTSSAAPRLEQVAFFNSTAGYGLFWQTPGGFCELAVAKTTDGGANFAVPVPVAPCGTFYQGTRASMAFDDHGDGFVYGASFYVTHDGGTSWEPDPQPGPVISVEALGDSVWMLEGDCAQPATETRQQPCPLRVYQSTDGGRSWAPSPAQPPSASMTGRVGDWWGSLIRVNASVAYVVAAPLTPTSAPNRTTPGTVPLYYTADGGRSWAQRTIPCGQDAQRAIASVAPSGALFSVCGWSTQVGGQQRKAVLVSTDDGATWSTKATCTALQRCSLASGYLGVVDAVSSTTAFAIGGRGQLLETTDGGAEWWPSQVNGGDGGPTGLVFFDPADGIALTTTHLWRTADAGQSWSETTPIVRTASLPKLKEGRVDWATLPAPVKAAVSAIDGTTAVAIEAPDVVPPSLSATARVARNSYSISLYQCPQPRPFGTRAIGKRDCSGLARMFGGFGALREPSAFLARAALRKDAASPLGCPTDRKLARRATSVPHVDQVAVAGTAPSSVCELTWRTGRWTVEIVGALTAGSETTTALPVIETVEHTSALPGSAGILVIDRAGDGDHTYAWWTEGATVYDVSGDHTLGVALSLVSDMARVSGSE